MLERPRPATDEALLDWLAQEGFVAGHDTGGYITNLGAIAASRRIEEFPDPARKAVRVVIYDGLTKVRSKREVGGSRGYAIRFGSLLQHVLTALPRAEVITQGLRKVQTVYPEIALREIIANALIHQNFSIQGSGPLIELFDDRVEVSSPGGLLPSKQVDRLIGTNPESRNEKLAKAFRRFKICEERGSGLQKAAEAVEAYGLPPIRFVGDANYVKVTLFGPRQLAQMSPRERLDACYQHAVVRHLAGHSLTNTSL